MSEIADRVRSERQQWAAPGGRHDRLVALARVVLPMGAGAMAAFMVMAPVFTGGDVSFILDKNKVEVAKERLRIQAAQYRGADAKGQPFVLRAGSAVQKSSAEPIVELSDLTANIRLDDGPATLRALEGRYNMQSETVAVEGPIRFRAADGYQIDTRDATVNLKTRQLTGTGAVSGSTPLGSFSGNSLEADLGKRVVRIEGDAHLRINPGRANRR